MIYFQSKYLAAKFKINLAKWKRWSREFLPPDPLGGLRSGYARQFSHKEAFCVYLAGYLVSGLKFTVPETRQILADLDTWLRKQGFFALPNGADVNAKVVERHIYIFQGSNHSLWYVIRSINAKSPLQSPEITAGIETLKTDGPEIGGADSEPVFGARLLMIDHLYHFFLGCLRG
jgi:hypothetical protein